jgi:transposase
MSSKRSGHISDVLARNNTDKIDADKLCRILKMQVVSGERIISPVTIPSAEIQALRSLFTTYRLYKKQNTQVQKPGSFIVERTAVWVYAAGNL